MQLKTGSYTGNGTDDRSITGIGFEPDAVFVWEDGSNSKVFRTSSGFSGDETTTFGSTTGLFANAIQALESDGFQVGTHSTVNTNAKTYFWLAIRDDGNGDFAVGNYTGDGVFGRAISVGFQPKFVIVKEVVGGARAEARIDGMPTNKSWTVGFSGFNSSGVRSLDSIDFKIGIAATVNTTGDTYVWIAFGYGATSTYTGNGADNRSITGSGFQPEFAVLMKSGVSTSRAKIDAIGDEKTLKFESAPLAATNEIQALESDGFQVGSDADVNGSGYTHYYFTSKDNPLATGISIPVAVSHLRQQEIV